MVLRVGGWVSNRVEIFSIQRNPTDGVNVVEFTEGFFSGWSVFYTKSINNKRGKRLRNE